MITMRRPTLHESYALPVCCVSKVLASEKVASESSQIMLSIRIYSTCHCRNACTGRETVTVCSVPAFGWPHLA